METGIAGILKTLFAVNRIGQVLLESSHVASAATLWETGGFKDTGRGHQVFLPRAVFLV